MPGNTLIDVTETIKNIVKGCKIIIESGDHKQIAKLHAINDYYQNQIERIIYGQTVKEMRNDLIEKNKKRIKEESRHKG